MQRLASGLWTRGGTVPRSVRALQLLTGLLIASFVASTIFRAHGTSIPFFDVWVENIAYACCALMCVWRAIARRPGRWGWGALGVRTRLLHRRIRRLHGRGPVLDNDPVAVYRGLLLSLRLSAGLPGDRPAGPRDGSEHFEDHLGRRTHRGARRRCSRGLAGHRADFHRGSTATSRLSRPTSRIRSGIGILVSLVVGVFAVRGWRPGRLWWTLGAGLLLFAGADSVYLLRVTSDDYVVGTPLDSPGPSPRS